MGILTIKNDNLAPDKETLEAQRQWEQDGTVTDKYLNHVLGDISKSISVFPSGTEGRPPANPCSSRSNNKKKRS